MVDLPYDLVFFVAVAALAGFLSLVPSFTRFRWQLRWSGLLFVFCALVRLANADAGLLARIPPADAHALQIVLGVALWFGVALLGSAFLKFAMRRWVFPDETQPHTRKLFADLAAGLLYLIAGVGILDAIFGAPLSGLLATSGIVAVVVGLALQSTLADLFSGVALNIERPARAGDWVSVAGGATGQILEINWRATRLKTLAGDLIVLPNSVIAKSVITNHSWSSQTNLAIVTVTFPHENDPDLCREALLTAARSLDIALKTPEPSVSLVSSVPLGITYELCFYVADYLETPKATSDALGAIWRQARQRKLAFAAPLQEVVTHSEAA